MKPQDSIEEKLKKLGRTIATDDSIVESVMSRIEAKSIAGPQPGRAKNIWRTLRQSRVTKLAAAAVIVVSVFIGVSHFGGSIDGASVAFAKMTEAMQNMPWMHAVYYERLEIDGEEQEGNRIVPEQWLSYESRIIAFKSSYGSVDYSDGYRRRMFEYDPDTETIQIRYWDPSYTSMMDGRPLSETTPYNFFDYYLKIANDPDSQISRFTDEHGGRRVDIFQVQVDKADHNSILTFVTDPVTHLPERLERSDVSEKRASSFYMEIDYPEEGPESIYDLGVPLSAKKIFDVEIPEDDLIEVWDRYVACKNDFCDVTRRYTAITTEADRAKRDGIWVDRMNRIWVEHRDHAQYSSFNYQLGEGMNRPDEPQTVNELPQSFDELLEWSRTIKLYPYYCGKTTQVFWKERGHYLGVVRKAWRILNPEGHRLVQDDYSIENNLICLERIQKRDSTYDQFLYYLNPRRDYICERYMSQWKIIDNEPDSVEIRDVVEYGKTDSGKWYPRMIHWISFKGDEQTGESTMMIYLRTDPKFPKGVFDPKVDQPEYEEDVLVPGRD